MKLAMRFAEPRLIARHRRVGRLRQVRMRCPRTRGTVVLSYRSPLALAQVRPPPLPANSGFGLLQRAMFGSRNAHRDISFVGAHNRKYRPRSDKLIPTVIHRFLTRTGAAAASLALSRFSFDGRCRRNSAALLFCGSRGRDSPSAPQARLSPVAIPSNMASPPAA
jgi:hypothetical protein